MTMFSIYKSLEPKIELTSHSLYENKTYYIVFNSLDDEKIKTFFMYSGLNRHFSWHPGNKVAELNIKNYVGLIRIFDKEFDVRSEKFGDGLAGHEQVALIISELDDLSKKISFSYDSTIFNKVAADWVSVQNNYIHKMNYLYQVFFELPRNERAGFQLEKIKRNSSLRYETVSEKKPIWKVKKITPSTAVQLVRNGYSKGSNKHCGDSRVFIHEQLLSNNTSENQFVLFFYEYCLQICLKILSLKKDFPDVVAEKSMRLLHECRLLLSDSFFETVNMPSKINTGSTVLTSRDGYSDLLKYYTNSLFSVKHIFEEYRDDLKVDLIDIATLYEIWCFYKLAHQILGAQIIVKEKTSAIKDGKIKYSTTFANDLYEVSYNRTYSISNKGSYSTTLRPDISVVKKDTNDLFHFDAKYRINSYIGSDDLEYKTFKNDDVNKMHAYLDAIFHSKSAIVLYPGMNFKFFVKGNLPSMIQDVDGDYDLNGVGALPLVPGQNNQYLERFSNKFF